MRELVLKMSMTFDGFVAGPNGENQWIFGPDLEAKQWVLDKVSNASLHIMGSKTFAAMSSFWPTDKSPFATPMNEIPKAVFTRQGKSIIKTTAGNWGDTYIAGGDLLEEIRKLKESGSGKPIVAHGGAAFARSLIAANLVDEYAIMVHPIALGKGMPIFTDLPASRPLKLVNGKVFPGGAIAHVYR